MTRAARRVPLFIVRVLVAMLVVVGPSRAEPILLREGGAAANRVDIVFIGDGYSAAEQGRFAADVERFVGGFFVEQPFARYAALFNVRRIDLVSAESGADHPASSLYRDTALGASFGCHGVDHWLCVDEAAVESVLASRLAADERDLVFVLVNDAARGAYATGIAVTSTGGADAVDLLLHETGHVLGGLADEYVMPAECGAAAAGEAGQPVEYANVATTSERDALPWNAGAGPPRGWVDPATSLPTETAVVGVPGAYEGAHYCASGYYRPTYASKMRATGHPFDAVNTEQLVLQLYRRVSPIDGLQPPVADQELCSGETRTWLLRTAVPGAGLVVEWRLDGQPVGAAREFTFDAAAAGAGLHTLEVSARDATTWVRNDPEALLSATAAFSLTVWNRDTDGDGDGLNDCDELQYGTRPELWDSDGDGRADGADNCPRTGNPVQADADGDGHGDACDPPFDVDGDAVARDDVEGVLLGRYLAGFRGAALLEDLFPWSSRLTPGDAASWAHALLPEIDLDGDGRVGLGREALMLRRYMHGLRGTALGAGLPLGPLSNADRETRLRRLVETEGRPR